MKKLGLLMVLFMLGTLSSHAQKPPKTKTIQIQTSAICGMCKDRIEDKLNYTKGIVFAELDLETKIVEVKFKTKYLTATQVRLIITSLGYDADDAKKNQEAYENLPGCCQKEGECK